MTNSATNFRRAAPGLWLAMALWLAASATGDTPKRVLIIHSFVNAAPPFTTHSTAFEAELIAKMGATVDLDEITLDVARFPDPEVQEALVEFMQKREARWRPDVVVPIGSPAGVFVADHRDRLFSDLPIVYCGMDRRRLPPEALAQNAAFVGEDFDLPGLVEDMLQVAPATTNIAVVIGASALEQYWKAAFQREFAPFTNRLHFEWLDELPFDRMLDRVSQLPPHSFIFLILYMRDATGVTHNADEALARIRAVANAPINSIFQHQLGLGIVGGRLYQAELEGVRAAQLAIRILNGESPTNFPPELISPLPPRYDARELQRWNINDKLLPAGSTVLFREPSFWERYQTSIVTVTTVMVVQALLILGLLVNRAYRRRAERTLTASRNRLRAILDSAGDAIVTIDKHGTIESVNLSAVKLFGYPAVEMVGRNVNTLVLSSFREGHNHPPAQSPTKGHTMKPGIGRVERGRRKDGSEFPVELSVNRFNMARQRMSAVFIRDITERKQAEQDARAFGGRLLQAQEGERARLARELHDDITQRLALLAIDAGRVQGDDDPTVRDKVMRDVRDGLVRLSEDVHALSYRLHPSLLEDLGLCAALQAECERFTRQKSIPVDVKIDPLPSDIDPGVGLCLFRVAQEALRNVARHAQARRATVSLRLYRNGLQLVMMDNGRGFDPKGIAPRQSLGLASMRERVLLARGKVEINSVPGQGTTILVWVPLKETT